MKYLSVFLFIALAYGGGKKKRNGGNKKPGKGGNDNGGPVNSCEKQSECLNTKITDVGVDEYEICVWWDSHLRNCRKNQMDSISHVCYGERESEKREGCNSGEKHKICRTVDCDTYARFGLKDGSECQANSDGKLVSAYAFSEVTNIICKAGTQGGMCNGAHKDCVWMIPAPECEHEYEQITTTDMPIATGTTISYSSTQVTQHVQTTEIETTTSTAPCIRQPPIGDICENQQNDESCIGALEGRADGCAWQDDMCTRACGYYNVSYCGDTCGCVAVGPDCIESSVMNGAASVAMRDDEYVMDQYVTDGENDREDMIKGVQNMYLYIGIGGIGLVVVLLIGLVIGLVMMKKRKRRYVEMNSNENMEEIQMNEIEVDGVHHTMETR